MIAELEAALGKVSTGEPRDVRSSPVEVE